MTMNGEEYGLTRLVIINLHLFKKKNKKNSRMTEKRIRDLCKKNQLYLTPRLNDVLYLHYQGTFDRFLQILIKLN